MTRNPYDAPRPPPSGETQDRHANGFLYVAAKPVAIIALLAGVGALLLGVVGTLFALTPGTDMADASVLIRTAPLYGVGGFVGLMLGRWIWRASNRRRLTPSSASGARGGQT